MEQYVCSARQALTCTTGCIWDLWPPCLLYFIGFLSTSSQRGKGKGIDAIRSMGFFVFLI